MNDPFIENGFIKIKKDNKKIVVELCNKKTYAKDLYTYDFETNIVYSLPNTDIKFAIACKEDIDGFVLFMINKSYNIYNRSVDSPRRTFYLKLIPDVFRLVYGFEYNEKVLKIDTNDVYFLKVRVIKI